jgi:RHS repeat-associated protein
VDDVGWTGSLPALPPPEPAATNWRYLEYTYDASGRRIEKKYDYETVTKYVYDGDHCIAEYNAYNQLKRKYIYGPGVDQPICMIDTMTSPAVTSYYHFDGLGSVTALTNASGNTVEVYEYDVYGRVGATDANHPNRILFTGREYDKETGLYYYRARYYNPQIGRFLQTDPIGYDAGMNLYRYCANNPVTLKDPSGQRPLRPSYPGDWSLKDFFGWYFFGPIDVTGKHRQGVTLSGVGLFDDVANLPQIMSFERDMKDVAISLAWQLFSAGGTYTFVSISQSIPYTFIQNDEALIGMIANNDPLVALGSGSVYATAVIQVRARPVVDPSTVTYDWWVDFQFVCHDAFEDAMDVHSNIPGFQEFPGGMGFDIDETWYWQDSGTVEFYR